MKEEGGDGMSEKKAARAASKRSAVAAATGGKKNHGKKKKRGLFAFFKNLKFSQNIGIDLGTSSVKLMLVDSAGEIKNTVTREYPVSYPRSGWSEQNAEDWWREAPSTIPMPRDCSSDFAPIPHGRICIKRFWKAWRLPLRITWRSSSNLGWT